MFLDCQNPLDLDLIILELLEPLETLAKRAARSAASILEIYYDALYFGSLTILILSSLG